MLSLALGLLCAGKLMHLWQARLVITLSVLLVVCTVTFWAALRRGTRSLPAQGMWLAIMYAAAITTLVCVIRCIDRSGTLWLHVAGEDHVVSEDLRPQVKRSLDAFLSVHPIFIRHPQRPGELLLRQGSYPIAGTILIPPGTRLTIEPGTELRFGAGCSLVSYSPLIARGAASRPIVFTARSRWLKWGAVGLVHTGRSYFQHVRFTEARYALVNGIAFWGGLSSIGTPIEVRQCEFVNMWGRDALYIRDAPVLVQDNVFRSSRKDGVDLDGGSGRVVGNLFWMCEDEGIDLSRCGSDLVVAGNTVLDRRGGRVASDHDEQFLRQSNHLGHALSFPSDALRSSATPAGKPVQPPL